MAFQQITEKIFDASYNVILSFTTTPLSIGAFVVAADTRSSIAWVVGVVSGLVAITSGCFAIRYYHHATKKLKNDK